MVLSALPSALATEVLVSVPHLGDSSNEESVAIIRMLKRTVVDDQTLMLPAISALGEFALTDASLKPEVSSLAFNALPLAYAIELPSLLRVARPWAQGAARRVQL